MYFLILITSSFFLVSCSTINKADCKKDMYTFGLDHGQKGAARLTDEIIKVCVSNQSTVKLEDYESGFAAGWSQYCSPINGFKLGIKGDLYKSHCPPEKEDLFKEKFYIGKKMSDKKDQLEELRDKIKGLSNNSKLSSADQSELQYLKKQADLLNLEIEKLEQFGKSPIHTDWN